MADRALPELIGDLIAALRSAGAVPLYVDDATLHRLVAPHLGKDSWTKALAHFEREGFPEAKSLLRARYWPACKAWLDERNGVRTNAAPINTPEDGREDFDAAERKPARVQTRPPRPAVLDRQAGGPGPNGIPRLVHSASERRER